jgi:hypothetical protein
MGHDIGFQALRNVPVAMNEVVASWHKRVRALGRRDHGRN